MTEESISHLTVAMTTHEIEKTQTTSGNDRMSSSSVGIDFYVKLAVIVMGVIGAAGNALILY